VSFGLGALLEPLSVAIHASRRAHIAAGSSVLIFGAGTIGLLCGAACKIAGALRIKIADIQEARVKFAIENGFAGAGLAVPPRRGETIEERLAIAKDVAESSLRDETFKGFDTVFECTGVEACTQAAIYVGRAFGYQTRLLIYWQATRPGGNVVLVGMGNPIQTLPISAAALREVDILGTFRYANTYPDAIHVVASKSTLLPHLESLITHRYPGLENVKEAFEMAGKTHDDEGGLVLKVVVGMS